MQRQECSGRDKSCKVVEAAIILCDPCFFYLGPQSDHCLALSFTYTVTQNFFVRFVLYPGFVISGTNESKSPNLALEIKLYNSNSNSNYTLPLGPSLLFVNVFYGEVVFVVTESCRNSKFASFIVSYRGGLIV